MKNIVLNLILCFGLYVSAYGNAVTISNVTSVVNADNVQLQFDLSWENSWRNSINYDAAWVFFKWKDLDGTWRHLNLTDANNSITSGYTLTVPADKTGAMIYRSSTGLGTVTLTGVRVGVTNYPGSFDISAFAIEMVNIPQAESFQLGDGSSTTVIRTAATTVPFTINSTAIPTMGSAGGQLNHPGGNGTISVGYPTGYTSATVYLMKHEVSQAAYRDFLNTLTYDQQANRIGVVPSSAAGTAAIGLISRRNGIEIVTPGVSNTTPAVFGCDFNNNNTYNQTTDGEWIVCGYLTWMDLAAFLDWAALRPMTEFEFEKACRGPVTAVSGEFAWGTTAIAASTYTITNSGATNEAATYTGSVLLGNCTYQLTGPGGNSPLRCGMHATSGATRVSAGAGYYGVLDLSGNIGEMVVYAGSNSGRSFTGVNGNGTLTANGFADVDFWPGINGNTTTTTANTAFGGTTGCTTYVGAASRGGSAGTTAFTAQVSNQNSVFSSGTTRSLGDGGRGIKSF